MPNPTLDLLLARRSVSANSLAEPGPNAAELELILRAASRVPDHKKLVPWRFILFQGEARAEFGKVLAEVCARRGEGPRRVPAGERGEAFPARAAGDRRDLARGRRTRPRRNGSKSSRPAPPART